MKQIDAEAFSRNIKLVVFAEEFCARFPEFGALFCGFLVDGLEDLGYC